MKTRPYRGKMIPVKKGGVNLQLCAQEKTLLNSILTDKIKTLELEMVKTKSLSNNLVLKRDLTYYKKIYCKLTKKRQCPNCKQYI